MKKRIKFLSTYLTTMSQILFYQHNQHYNVNGAGRTAKEGLITPGAEFGRVTPINTAGKF